MPWVAGTTNSPDYPVTGQFQPFYLASAPPPTGSSNIYPPPASGYITELNQTGTGLFYSTYFSGSVSDTINFGLFTPGGIYISGEASSPDLPGFQQFPQQCLPVGFSSLLSANGLHLIATSPVPGTVLAYDPSNSTLLSWDGNNLISSNPAVPQGPIACILDSADLRHVSSIAPGELLSIFGQNFTSETRVSLGRLPAPLLYVSPQQINLQVPFEIANSRQTALELSAGVYGSRVLGVVPTNPVAFPVAFNSDGSENTRFQPAASGSPVRILLSGLGVTGTPQISFLPSGAAGTVLHAEPQPGAIAGVWAVDLAFPASQVGAVSFSLLVNGSPVRDKLTIWTQ